jgi:hypothetical protein
MEITNKTNNWCARITNPRERVNMQEIIEIQFEEVQLEKVTELLAKLCSTSMLIDYQISSDEPEINLKPQSQVQLFNIIKNSSDGAFYFNFSDFKLNELELSGVGFQIYKYNDKYDLNLHIMEKEVTEIIPILTLQNWAGLLATEVIAKAFYCGYEPAMDEETRFFTGKTLGPLKF